MQIIAIRKIKNNVHVIIDTGEELLLNNEVFIKNGLRKNDILDVSQILNLNRQNKIYQAKQTALNILSRRDHSKKELERKLYQRKIEKEIIEEVIQELSNLNYLDDVRFTKEYLEEKLRLKTSGKEKIKKELFAKGVSRDIIIDVLDEKGDIDETDVALNLANKKMKLISRKNQDKWKIKQKIYSFLLSRGYDYETIEKVLNNINFDLKPE
jgi:regulatory protein